VPYREVRSVETCSGCGRRNHVVVCYSNDPEMNAPEAEYCFGCGETIKAETCLAIFVAASSASMESTVVAFKSGRLCATLQRPPGIS
jgi:hypothetical protein